MNSTILKTLLPVMFTALSGPMQDMAKKGVRAWYEHSKTTENPLDDLIARFLCGCLGVDGTQG